MGGGGEGILDKEICFQSTEQVFSAKSRAHGGGVTRSAKFFTVNEVWCEEV